MPKFCTIMCKSATCQYKKENKTRARWVHDSETAKKKGTTTTRCPNPTYLPSHRAHSQWPPSGHDKQKSTHRRRRRPARHRTLRHPRRILAHPNLPRLPRHLDRLHRLHRRRPALHHLPRRLLSLPHQPAKRLHLERRHPPQRLAYLFRARQAGRHGPPLPLWDEPREA
ncbi:hypothetical protein BOTBODRAFT_509572 [Botryobasidium botryosum FD-172 SS1]|uniref:Uncharacterized protein n=1 Tax=Botryobasidium botryosum (strain FD-172 SS1) TaxID=930990 RepID=A0A067MUI1_BOTB1|nr:hypothetical protein BOTBODRAFT_509572 [Botryobasidium botryosum FD-172 SS1]